MKLLISACFFACIQINRADIDRAWWKSDEEIDRSYGQAAGERGSKSQHESINKILSKADECMQNPSERFIPELSESLRKLQSKVIYQTEDRIAAYDRAQRALLSVPGHAKYFQDKIEALRSEVLATANLSEDERGRIRATGKDIAHVTDYENYCSMTAFPTLANLPSPETVAVLGSYLNETTGRDGKTLLGDPRRYQGSDDSTLRPCNAELAAGAIANLSIENPPYTNPNPGKLMYQIPNEWVDHWKDWWNEVKAGKRTYRFAGSDIEYGPDGPATKEQLEKVTKDRKRAGERKVGRDQGEPPPDTGTLSKGKLVALILAVAAVLGSVFRYFRKTSK